MVCKNGQSPYILTYGHPYITETFLGYQFEVSPASFFQINTHAAEEMYKVALDVCGLHKNAVLLDVCCGAGIISFLMYLHSIFTKQLPFIIITMLYWLQELT